MGKVILGLWAAVILFAGFWFGYYQEGANRDLVIEIEGKGSAPGSPIKMDTGMVYVTGSKVAFVGTGQDSGKLIVDVKAKELVIVVDAQKVVMRLPLDLVDKSQCEPPKAQSIAGSETLKRQPDTKTIAGYRCHKFAVEMPQGRMTAWFTYELSLGRNHLGLINTALRFNLKGDLGKKIEEEMKRAGAKRPQVSGFDYFPLPFSLEVQTRQGSFSYTVKSIKYGKADKKAFEIPSGYSENEIDLDKLLQQLGGQLGGH